MMKPKPALPVSSFASRRLAYKVCILHTNDPNHTSGMRHSQSVQPVGEVLDTTTLGKR